MFEGKPDLPLPALADFAALHFDVRGRVTALGSERDQNVSIIDDSNAYVLKVANLGDEIAMLELQNRIMQAAAQYQSLPPVPRIVASRRNRFIEIFEHAGQHFAVRLVTLLPGVAAARVAGTTALWRDVGRSAAHLDRALLTVASDLKRPMLWDITSAPQARQFLRYVSDSAERQLLGAVLDDGEATTLPLLARLPRQWIHNDLNLNNVLVDPQKPTEVCGIIDFGDMDAAPRVVELAIAAAHQCGREADPLRVIRAVASAYHRVSRLEEAEIALLAPLVVLRLAMAVLIRNARVVTTSSHFDPADYAGLMSAVSALKLAGPERCADTIRRSIQEGLMARNS